MAESNTFTGTIASVRDTYQKLTSLDRWAIGVQWACFNKSPFMKAVALEGFGVDAMKSADFFGAATPTGRIIVYDSGKYGIRGAVFATAPNPYFVGRLGTFTPELIEGGDEFAYSWHRLVETTFIPDVDVDDNRAGLIDIKAQKMEGMKQKYVEGFNYAILGHSSAPDYSTMGPRAVYSDLPNLISVTQTRTVGAIPTTNSFWQNGHKAITSIGGGGEMDRPLVLRRSMMKAKNDRLALAETTDDYLFVATQGGHQLYDRLMYADMIQGGRGGAFVRNAKYDSAGIKHHLFDGDPMVWDGGVTVPYTCTAGTECIYGINIPNFFISLRTEENFKVSEWEPPREHDVQKTYVSSIKTRFTPGVISRRPHFVCYNIPACAD